MHHVVDELALVNLSIVSENVGPGSMEAAVNKVALVSAGVSSEGAFATLLTVDISALEADIAFLPFLRADALLFVIDPFTLIDGLLDRAVIDSISICLAIDPVAPVQRTIRLLHLAATIELVVRKLPAVFRPILECDAAKTLWLFVCLREFTAIQTAVSNIRRACVPGKGLAMFVAIFLGKCRLVN